MRLRTIPLYALACAATTLACNPHSEDSSTWRETIATLGTGVEISVEISQPIDGSVVPAGPLWVEGFATIGETSPTAQTTLAYVVDVSGSTLSSGGCGGDLNNDGYVNTVLDCQIAALLAVNEMAIATGTVAEVGASVFGSQAATADVMPGGTDSDWLTAADADLDGDLVADMEQVLRSLEAGYIGEFTAHEVGSATAYGAGLDAIKAPLLASNQPHKLVVMVSDGKNNTGPHVDLVLPTLPIGTVVHTFAVGVHSACDVDLSLGSLQDIADATGGSCTEVPDVAELPNLIPAVIGAKLIGLTLTANGAPVTIDTITPVLPQIGPHVVNYSTTLPDLGPGEHELCATATGTDALGEGEVSECVKVRVNRPPRTVCKDVWVAADASCSAAASIDGGSWDPDGDELECEVDPEGPYPIGTTHAALTCTDPSGASSSCEATIEVSDESPPAFEAVELLALLWPPTHQYEEFSISDCVGALTHSCGPELLVEDALELVRVSSDEPELGLGSGQTCEDIVITSPTTFKVRAERMGSEDGRVYTATFKASGQGGGVEYGSCKVLVPISQNPNTPVVDSGCALCVGEGCGTCSSGDPACD